MPISYVKTHSGHAGLSFNYEREHGVRPHVVKVNYYHRDGDRCYRAVLSCGCIVHSKSKREILSLLGYPLETANAQ